MNILEARRRTLGGHILKKTAHGNPAIATDSLARMYPGIEMQGWTEQDSTTGAQLFNKNTVDKNKYISDSNGNAYEGLGGRETSASDYIQVSGLSYVFATKTGYRQWMAFYDKDKNFISGLNGYGSLQVPQSAEYARFTIPSSAIDTFMVNEGSTALPWEPYTGRKPSPSPEYPQEITSAGNWNETAQKWEYEIEISNAEQNPTEIQTVTLQSDRPLTKWDKLEKRNGQWGWVYKSEEIESYTDGGVPGEYFSTTGQLSVGAQVWYETTTETFVPLTTAEQEAMNALYTYRPTTVLSNQQDCDMTLTYKSRKGMS